MSEGLPIHSQRQRSAADLTRRSMRSIGLTAAVGSAYFLAAKLGIGLPSNSGFVSVFWPAFGLSSGVLIALGPRARWPVGAGVIVASVATHLDNGDPLWVVAALALGSAAETLITAGLIERYFGSGFSLDRLRHVLGLVAAVVLGSVASGIWWIVASRLFQVSTEPILTTWQHWFMSDIVGFVTLGPFVIGLIAAVRQPPPRSELIEGTAVLVALAVVTAIIILLPLAPWKTVSPIAALFPMLLWLAARCQSVFAAGGACLVSIMVVSATVFGIGHFGDDGLTIDDRVLQAQTAILFVALGAFILSSLFAERRESEVRLTRLNMMVERERDNKLLNAQAITAAIAHEVRQPLAAIATNASAALRFLGRAPPDHDEVGAALNSIIGDSHRTSEVFDGIRALFGKVSQERRQPIDMNEIVLGVLQSLREELKDHGVATRPDLTSELPLVGGHRGQLREVIFNLVQNALEAMDTTTNRSRVLEVRTELRGHDAIVVSVQDSGPGIDPRQLDAIFGAFLTTKAHGTGLGLAICRMIAEHHGGQLTASSDGYSGALFQFVLPIEFTDKGTASPERGH
jgi:signal transduction histidine kinase